MQGTGGWSLQDIGIPRQEPGNERVFLLTRILAFALLLLAFLTGPPANAHPAFFTAARATVHADGAVRITLSCDILAFALNDTSERIGNEPMEALLSGPRDELERRLLDARERLRRGTVTFAGAAEVAPETVRVPDVTEIEAWKRASGPPLPVVLESQIDTRLPRGTRTVAFQFPSVLDRLILTVERPGEDAYSEPVEAGQPSTALPVHLSEAVGTARIAPPPTPPRRSWTALVLSFIAVGFRHIFPEGLDHILFVLGLVLLNPRVRPLLFQVTAFTIAHSITLGLAVYGIIRIPAGIVEPAIAISIALIAIENVCTAEMKPWRPAVVFAFGLVHGVGFAAALIDAGLAPHDFLGALVGFNTGVELGQLTVVALAMSALVAFRNAKWYRRGIAIPASGIIAAVALVWAVQRMG